MIIWNNFTKDFEILLSKHENNFKKLKEKLTKQFGYSPIEKISSRIKTESSTQKKLAQKNLPLTKENLEKIKDIAGIRIICKFLDDIPELISLIKNDDSLKVTEEKDFINKKKESGYCSYHIICKDIQTKLNFEIQLRTMAMDFWATNEHLLKYKYADEIPLNLQQELKEISNITNQLDQKMNNIRKDIKVGTITSRIIQQIFKSIHILEQISLNQKANFYRNQLIKNKDNIEQLRKLAIRAKEDVPKQYWK